MRIWLVTVGEPLPQLGGRARLLRAGLLSRVLVQQGHDVLWWTSTFDHWSKRHLAAGDTEWKYQAGLRLRLLHGCGYRRNISLRRILDHVLVANRFRKLAELEPPPDVILCSLPTLELSLASIRYGERHSVPVILDVRDLWPDIFLEFVPRWALGIARFGISAMRRQVRRACAGAYALTGNAPAFVDWGLRQAKRTRGRLDRHFPFGYPAQIPDDTEIEAAYSYWAQHGITRNQEGVLVCFFGTMGHQFDLETVVDAAFRLESEGYPIRFVLCGVGERLESLRRLAGASHAIVFPGWVGWAEINVLMRMADVGLAPYRNHAGFVGNMPNKPIEYFAGGLPVVSSLDGYLSEFLDTEQCGRTYQAGNVRALCDILKELFSSPQQLAIMAHNASQVYSEHFDADQVYGRMCDYLIEVIDAYRDGLSTKK